jgi:hypothetical protein
MAAVKLKATEEARMPLQHKLNKIRHTPLYKDCNDEALVYIVYRPTCMGGGGIHGDSKLLSGFPWTIIFKSDRRK